MRDESDHQQPTDTPLPGSIQQTAGDHSTQIGQVSGDVHIGDVIQAQSSVEALRNFLGRAIPDYENRLLQTAYRTPLPTRPYKFLYAYTLADAPIFFGRDEAIRELIDPLFRQRLTVLHAKSGTGKTSLLQAGLSAQLLRKNCLPIYVRAGSDPILALKTALAPPSLGVWPDLLDTISLPQFLGLACAFGRAGQEWVVIFDQLEEFFIHQPNLAQRQPFIQALGDCCADASLPVRFLLSLRDDYLAELADFSERLNHIFHNLYRLQSLTRASAAAAITEPLKQVNPALQYDPPLVERLLDDLEQAGLQPAQVQIVCTRLFESLPASEHVLYEAHYQSLGAAAGILRNYLVQAVEFLGPLAPLGRAVLAELVTSEDTRQALTTAEIRQVLSQRTDLPHLGQVMETLIQARLVQPVGQEMGPQADWRYELAHDTLITAIRAWVTDDDLQARRARESLRRALANWRSQGWLLDRPALEFIHAQRQNLSGWTSSETELMLRSAIQHQIFIETWALAAYRLEVEVWPILQPALTANDAQTRASIVALLPTLGETALPALTQALEDPYPQVRIQALRALGQLGTPAAQAPQRQARYEVFIPSGTETVDFFMDRWPVTNADYERFLQDHPEIRPPVHWGKRQPPEGLADHPVVNLSWHAVVAYADWAGKRLPTAAEWSAACGECAYPWGDDFHPGRGNTRESGVDGTTPVGIYSPEGDSPLGVADLAGNIWEWLSDTAGAQGDYQQLRGGAWCYSAVYARRDYDHFWRKPDHYQDNIGFRLCFSVE